MKYTKGAETVDAVRWFGEGDHPEVIRVLITPEGIVTEDSIIYAAWEYAIGNLVTLTYGMRTEEGLVPVAPGDYIVTDARGESHPCSPEIFESTYAPAVSPGTAP